ncbi:hypothetical protein BMF94_3748 [Rhodotorula taiwanensis]|uniref:Uncharacterized protein n=1 Tax=Rhodotorula taiwanensis TaxID=741276 RepID=A0A2S5B9F1_9BASI|nr:hypothetical protein BMF94_3748 [Rhodotorula taiwanensis]
MATPTYSRGKIRAPDRGRAPEPHPTRSKHGSPLPDSPALDSQDVDDLERLEKYSREYWIANEMAETVGVHSTDRLQAEAARDNVVKKVFELLKRRNERFKAHSSPMSTTPRAPLTPTSPTGEAHRESDAEESMDESLPEEIASLVHYPLSYSSSQTAPEPRIKATEVLAALTRPSGLISLDIPPLDAYIGPDGTVAAADVKSLATVLQQYIHGIASGTRLAARLQEVLPTKQLSLTAPTHETWQVDFVDRS